MKSKKTKSDSRMRKMIAFLELSMALYEHTQEFEDNFFVRGELKRRASMVGKAASTLVKTYQRMFSQKIEAPEAVEAHLEEMSYRGSIMFEIAWIFAHIGTESAEGFAAHVEHFAKKLMEQTEDGRVCSKCGTQVYIENEQAMCARCNDKATAVMIEDYQLAKSMVLDHGFAVTAANRPSANDPSYAEWLHTNVSFAADIIELIDSKRLVGVNRKIAPKAAASC